jgi:hypothetical protein
MEHYMKSMLAACLVIALLTLPGCSKQKWYYNHSIAPAEQQTAYNHHRAYCKGMTTGMVPEPTFPLTNNHMSNFERGFAFADAVYTRDSMEQSCMYQLGWREVPPGYVAPYIDSADSVVHRYQQEGMHKALAESTNGIVGAAWNHATITSAKSEAINSCIREGGIGCYISNVDGFSQ